MGPHQPNDSFNALIDEVATDYQSQLSPERASFISMASLSGIDALSQDLIHVSDNQISSTMQPLSANTASFYMPQSGQCFAATMQEDGKVNETEFPQTFSFIRQEYLIDEKPSATNILTQGVGDLGLGAPYFADLVCSPPAAEAIPKSGLSEPHFQSPDNCLSSVPDNPDEDTCISAWQPSNPGETGKATLSSGRMPSKDRESKGSILIQRHTLTNQRNLLDRSGIEIYDARINRPTSPKNAFQIVQEDGRGGPLLCSPAVFPIVRARRQGPLSVDGRRDAALRRKDRSVCLWCRLSKKKVKEYNCRVSPTSH